MKTLKDELPFFAALMKMLKNHLGPGCEIVLHDWSEGYEKSVVLIENGDVTGRKIGDCGSNLGLEVLRGTVDDGDRHNYITRTTDGKSLKSSTMYVKDSEGNALGALCINTDISAILNIQKTINDIIPRELTTDKNVDEFFATDVSDLLGYLLQQSLNLVDRPVSEMSKEDKMTALRFLDEKGALLISKSGTKICQALDISKFTMYNYLDEIRHVRV